MNQDTSGARPSRREAEPDDSGSRTLVLSPCRLCALTSNMQLYGFLHQHVYQYVNGVQLNAEQVFVAGFSARF